MGFTAGRRPASPMEKPVSAVWRAACGAVGQGGRGGRRLLSWGGSSGHGHERLGAKMLWIGVKSEGRGGLQETRRLWPEQLAGVTLFTGTGMERETSVLPALSLKCPHPRGRYGNPGGDQGSGWSQVWVVFEATGLKELIRGERGWCGPGGEGCCLLRPCPRLRGGGDAGPESPRRPSCLLSGLADLAGLCEGW